jgi:hypothetical protein
VAEEGKLARHKAHNRRLWEPGGNHLLSKEERGAFLLPGQVMPVVAVHRLKDNDVLASDVWSNTGRLLCAKGTAVSEQTIDQFKRFGVDLVHVEERNDDLSFLSEEQTKELQEAVHNRFTGVQGDKFLMRLKDAVVSTIMTCQNEGAEIAQGGLTAQEFLDAGQTLVYEAPLDIAASGREAQAELHCIETLDMKTTSSPDRPQLRCVVPIEGGDEITPAELGVKMPAGDPLAPNDDEGPLPAESAAVAPESEPQQSEHYDGGVENEVDEPPFDGTPEEAPTAQVPEEKKPNTPEIKRGNLDQDEGSERSD